MKLDRVGLEQLLLSALPSDVADDLIEHFVQLRVDVTAGTLGRVSAGKFVEATIKALQHLESGEHDDMPNVDAYLRDVESKTALDPGLRLCAARVARAMYTLRNKRSIAHIGPVDPNRYDQMFLFQAAQWVLAELVRVIGGTDMDQTGATLQAILSPAGGIVEDFGDHLLVLADLPATQEVLMLLYHSDPSPLDRETIRRSMSRRSSSTIQKALKGLWDDKQVAIDAEKRVSLTARGRRSADELARQLAVDPD